MASRARQFSPSQLSASPWLTKIASCRSSAATAVPSAFSYRHVQGIDATPLSPPTFGPKVNVRHPRARRSGAEENGPDGLTAAGHRAPAPDVAQRVYHLQAAAGLFVPVRHPEHRGAVRRIEHGAHDFAGPAQQAQAECLAGKSGPRGVRYGVGHELADDR